MGEWKRSQKPSDLIEIRTVSFVGPFEIPRVYIDQAYLAWRSGTRFKVHAFLLIRIGRRHLSTNAPAGKRARCRFVEVSGIGHVSLTIFLRTARKMLSDRFARDPGSPVSLVNETWLRLSIPNVKRAGASLPRNK